MANPWFRMYHEWDSDPKVQSMTEAMQRRLAMLFCSRCKEETLQERDRAFHWRISMEELTETKAVFMEKGFIDGNWNPINWNHRQFLSDSSTDRVRRYRQGLKQDETLQVVTIKQSETPCSVSVSVSDSVSVKKSFVLPPWIDSEAWAGFEEMLRKIRAPLTDRARNGIIKELQKLCPAGGNGAEILDQSTQRGWRGIFAISTTRTNGGNHAKQAGADNQRETSTAENYATWLSMSDEFQKTNPWQGPTE